MSELESAEQYDIFISYNHGDNTAFGQGEWVSEFKNDLFKRIKQKEGRPLKIYIDQTQSGIGGTLPDQLRIVLENSKYLLPVVSPLYTKSDWCEEERRLFIETYGPEEALKRLIRVDKEPVEDVAGELEDLKQYRFYYRDEGKQIDLVSSKENQPGRYYELITELALHILHGINAVNKTRNNTIYVARTTPSLTKKRSQICNELEQRGFNVVPTSLGILANKAREKAARILENAFMSIHLVDEKFEPILKGQTESIDCIQFEEALKIGSENLKIYVWTESSDSDDPAQQALFEKIQSANIEDHLHDFQSLREEVTNAATKQQKPEQQTQTGPDTVNIYLHYAEEDEDASDLINLNQILLQQGVEVFQPDFTKPESEQHAYKADCNAILYYFGKSDHAKTLYSIKTGTDFSGDCLARGIYVMRGKQLKNSTTKAVIMTATGDAVVAKELSPFLTALGLS